MNDPLCLLSLTLVHHRLGGLHAAEVLALEALVRMVPDRFADRVARVRVDSCCCLQGPRGQEPLFWVTGDYVPQGALP